MGLIERLRGNGNGTEEKQDQLVEALREGIAQREDSMELLVERLAELELALEDEGWLRLGLEGELDFSLEGTRRLIKLSRLMAIKNPLIKNGVRVQCNYVFGQGMQVKASDPRVNEVVQKFLEAPANERVLTSHKARWERERDLQVEGNLFFALFVNQSTGETTVRFLPVLEIDDIICNPDDRDEPWWYKRVWSERRVDLETGRPTTKKVVKYYRDWRIPENQADRNRIGGDPVAEDVWVYHLKVGSLSGMRFGVPETYASLDWARGYKDYLSNWASLAKALARWAWKLVGKSKQLRKAKTKVETSVDTTEGTDDNPPPVTASTALVPQGMDLQAMPKSGAQVSADDGVQLRKMAAAGMGIGDNVMSADPQQGTMATAKTLDRPTELSMRDRQMLWADVFRDLLRFVVTQAKAPNGRLREAADNTDEPLDPTIVVDFPDILERDPRERVRAVVDAYTAGGRPAAGLLPPKLVTQLLMVALAVDDPEKFLAGFTPGEDVDVPPEVEAAVAEVRRVLLEAVGDTE